MATSNYVPANAQPFNVYRLIFSEIGVLTATIQLFLLHSIAIAQRRAPSWAAAAEDCSLSGPPSYLLCDRGCEVRDGKASSPVTPAYRIFTECGRNSSMPWYSSNQRP